MQKIDGLALTGALESLAKIESDLVREPDWLADGGSRRAYVINAFEEVRGTLEGMDLALSAARAQSAAAMLAGGESPTGAVVQGEIRALRESVGEELAEETLFKLSPDDADLLAVSEDAGQSGIVQGYPVAAFDLEEAARCLAFERWTAAMLHMGRALDEVLLVVASRHGIMPLRDWAQLIKEFDQRVEQLPVDGRVPWFEARLLLEQLRAGWGNEARTAPDRATEESARACFAALTGFVHKLDAMNQNPPPVVEQLTA